MNNNCFGKNGLSYILDNMMTMPSIRQKFYLTFVLFCLICLGTILASAAQSAQHRQPPQNIQHQITVFSKPQTIDRVYQSMTGLVDNQQVSFTESEKPELLWLTGFKVEVVDSVTNAPKSQEYLCHSHLKFNPDTFDIRKRNKAFGPNLANQDYKFVTLIQGRTEVDLPPNFGLPISSDEPFIFHSMVINNNPMAKPFSVKTKATFNFLRDKELVVPVKPVFRRCLTIRVPVSLSDQRKSSCHSMGEDVDAELESAQPVQSTERNVLTNKEGQQDSYHWFVPPGRHQYRYILAKGLELPYDTTVHHISIHVHAYAKSLELRDVTTGKRIFKSRVKNYNQRIGVAESQCYSSAKGIPVFKNHQYELICEYDNPTSNDIDAMAVLYAYFLTKSFDRESLGMDH